jgi:hypothetical protein
MPIQQATRSVPREDLGVAFHEYDPATDGFIADLALPPADVSKKAATMGVITRENLKRADSNHNNGAAFNRVTLISEDKSFACKDHGLEGQLTDEDRATYVTDYDAEYETTQVVTRKMFQEREIRVKDAMFNTTTFTGSDLYTDNSGSPWDNVATNIITQVGAAKTKVRLNTGVMPDTLLVGQGALENMLMNTGIIARFRNTTEITRQMIENGLSALFGLQNLIVGKAGYDSATEGQSWSGSEIWADDYALVYKRHTGGRATPGLGRNMVWTGVDGGLGQVKEYREEQTESDIFRVRDFSIEWLFDAYFGHLMKIDA